MKKSNQIILTGLMFLIFFVSLNSISLASNVNVHHHLKVPSPFAKNGEVTVFHCRSIGHYLAKICPHHQRDKGQRCVISSECGGFPSKKNSIAFTFDTMFFEIQETALFESPICSETFPFYVNLRSIFCDISDPPPKISI